MEMLLLKQIMQSQKEIPFAADSPARLEPDHGVPTCQEDLTSSF